MCKKQSDVFRSGGSGFSEWKPDLCTLSFRLCSKVRGTKTCFFPSRRMPPKHIQSSQGRGKGPGPRGSAASCEELGEQPGGSQAPRTSPTPSPACKSGFAPYGCSEPVKLISEQLVISCRFLKISSLTGLVGAWGPCVQDPSCKGRKEKEGGPHFPRAAGLCGSCLSLWDNPEWFLPTPKPGQLFCSRVTVQLIKLG